MNNVGSSCLSSPKQVLLSFAGQQRERDVTAPWRTPRECEALNHPVPLSADIPLARLFDKGFGDESRKVHTTGIRWVRKVPTLEFNPPVA